MYCGNCGKFVADDSTFCGECGAPVNGESAGNTVNGQNQTAQSLAPAYNNSPRYVENKAFSTPPKKKNGILASIIIILVCFCVAASAAIVFLLLRDDDDDVADGSANTSIVTKNNDDDANSALNAASKQNNGSVLLTVDTYDTETMVNPYILSGTIFSRDNTAVLTVNGENIGSVSSVDGTTQWRADVYLLEGENIIDVILEDSAGNTAQETVTINYTEAWPFPYGTELTRTSNEANYMIFVRPGPSKDSGDPILKIMPGDFVTTLIYLGEYYYEDSADGFHYWYKVELPDGREGWIRDDLAMQKR